MRLDLFLKTSRLVKRRALARELCENGRVLINGHQAKPARDVKQGDILTLQSGSRVIDLEIMEMPEGRKRFAGAVRILSERMASDHL